MSYYKYFPPERTDVLSNLAIRFTPPSDFNDPFDGNQAINFVMDQSFLEEMLQRAQDLVPLLGKHPEKAADFSEFVRHLAKNPTEEYRRLCAQTEQFGKSEAEAAFRRAVALTGVLSLSKAENHPLMWSHYARSHQGFVIEFREEDDFFTKGASAEPDPLEIPQAVAYTKTRVVIDAAKPADRAALRTALLTKADAWGYEQEWRMVRDIRQSDFRGSGGVPLFKIPASAISRLILGCKASKALTQTVLAIKGTNADLAHVTIHVAEMHPTDYMLNIRNHTGG